MRLLVGIRELKNLGALEAIIEETQLLSSLGIKEMNVMRGSCRV